MWNVLTWIVRKSYPPITSSYSQERNAALGMILQKYTEFCSFLHVYESVLFVSKEFLGQC